MAKKRVSVTLDEEVVERIDTEADRRDMNRSRMMEEISQNYFRRRGLDTAVILCGGENLRSLELHNGKPVLSHILDHIEEHGLKRAILLTGKNDEIRENFGSEYKNLALEYVEEDDPKGTAAALKKAESKVERDFVVMNGHVIADVDIQDMLNLHDEKDVTATMALTAVDNPSEYGVAKLKGSSILGFAEKPEQGEEPSRLINAGTYILSPEIFSNLKEDSLEEAFERLSENSELAGYIYGGDWVEIQN